MWTHQMDSLPPKAKFMLPITHEKNVQVAVVTGGASGIGLAIARRCAEQGCKVVLSDGNPRLLSEARDGIIALRGGIKEAGGCTSH